MRFAQPPVVRRKRRRPRTPWFGRFKQSPPFSMTVPDAQQVAPKPAVIDGVETLRASWRFEHRAALVDVRAPNRLAIRTAPYEKFVRLLLAHLVLGHARQHR